MLDGYVGSTLGINFPVYCRSAFGMRGSYFAVFVRGVVAVIWFGNLASTGWHENTPADDADRYTIVPGRTMPGDYDLRNLAFLQSLPQSLAGERTRHLRRAAMLLPLHHYSAAATLSSRLKSSLAVHGEDGCDANLRLGTIHLGPSRRLRIWTDLLQAYGHHGWYTSSSRLLPMRDKRYRT